MAITQLIDIILHVDKYLITIVDNYGLLIYAILFLIIFAETGLVFTPFLPGDSLLFAVGALAATGTLNITAILILLIIAAILGDTTNYTIGKYLGQKIIKNRNRLIKQEHLQRTEQFYKKYGTMTIVLGRFLPIIRTFAPFTAGLGKMEYKKFLMYNIIGGIAWIGSFTLGGYFLGNIPIVKENFGLLIIAIIMISLAIPVIGYLKHKNEQTL